MNGQAQIHAEEMGLSFDDAYDELFNQKPHGFKGMTQGVVIGDSRMRYDLPGNFIFGYVFAKAGIPKDVMQQWAGIANINSFMRNEAELGNFYTANYWHIYYDLEAVKFLNEQYDFIDDLYYEDPFDAFAANEGYNYYYYNYTTEGMSRNDGSYGLADSLDRLNGVGL